MNQQRPSKNAADVQSSKYRSNLNVRKGSIRQVHFTEGKKAGQQQRVSRLSAASRVFYHKRSDRSKGPKYLNSYRLESSNKFNAEVVDGMIKDMMESKLSQVTFYHPAQMAKMCLEIAGDLQKAICKKEYDRYKVVVQVSILQRLDQAANSSFQCLWDVDKDNYSSYIFENNHIHAWCCVFGIYYE